MKNVCIRTALLILASTLLLSGAHLLAQDVEESEIDFTRARQLIQRARQGETLTPEEREYLERARAARRAGARNQRPQVALEPRSSVGLVPLSDMAKEDRYKGEDGGLYGSGRNTPPESHRKAAEAELAKILPLDEAGNPDDEGKIVLISISMSNATQEFSMFKRVADTDSSKSPQLIIVDCAQGGQAMHEWADPEARAWKEASRRLTQAGVSKEQVQLTWVKLANKTPRGSLNDHGKPLQRDTLAVLQIARQQFPNLRIAYLSSRIYAGYAVTPLNPEPYAYESAFVVRWLIQDQIRGDGPLNFDPEKGEIKAPLLLWGPYLWADGVNGREMDELVWEREDLARDGTHPSMSGRQKVAKLLLGFFKTDPLARSWWAFRF